MKEAQIAEALARIETLLKAQGEQPMTLPQAATYLNLSKSTLYGLTSRSAIPHYKPGGKKIIFRKSDLDAFLFSHRVASREEVRASC